jgi:hypothetical protein
MLLIRKFRSISGVRAFVAAAAACCALFAPLSGAAVIGPGLVSSDPAADTGDRLNVDDTFTVTLAAGNYSVDNFTYNSVGVGTVVPFLATSTAADTYQLLWIGGPVSGAAATTVAANTAGHFQLAASTTVYAGFYTAGGRVAFTGIAGKTTDHNGTVTVPRGGVAIGGFNFPNLARTYAFSTTANPTAQQTAGPGILSVDGVDGGDRLNVDQAHPLTLTAGTYDVTDFSFNGTTATGTVTPFLVRLLADNSYQTVWVGQGVAGLVGASRTDPTGSFTLAGGDTLYAGFYTAGGATVAYTEAAGRPPGFGLTDHDNAFTGPTAAGQSVDTFSNPDLARQYSFDISVAAPEPGAFSLLALAAIPAMARRRRR